MLRVRAAGCSALAGFIQSTHGGVGWRLFVMGALARWRARKVVSYIESNLSGALVVGALARIAGISCSRFHRTFRLRFGVTPHAYVTLKRIQLAQNLMLTTNEPLSQISLACGMTD